MQRKVSLDESEISSKTDQQTNSEKENEFLAVMKFLEDSTTNAPSAISAATSNTQIPSLAQEMFEKTFQMQTQSSLTQPKSFIQIDFSYFKSWQSKSSYLVKFGLTNLVLTFKLSRFGQYICEFDQHPDIAALPSIEDRSRVFNSVKTKLTAELNKVNNKDCIEIRGQDLILNRVNEIRTKLPNLLKFYDVLPIQTPQPASQIKVFTPHELEWQKFLKKRNLTDPVAMTSQTTAGSSSEESQNNLQESVIQSLNKRRKK